MVRTVDISRLRQEIFRFFDELLRRKDERLIIERRGYDARVVMTSEQYLLDLEGQLEALKAVVSRLQAGSAEGFKLIGSVRLQVEPDDVLAVSRQAQARLRATKRNSI